MKKVFVLLAAISLLGSCISVVRVQKSEELVKNKSALKKVVCISPDLIFYSGGGFSEIDYSKTLKNNPYFFNRLGKYAQKAGGFEYAIYHPLHSDTLSPDYFNSLLPLKSELLETLFERDMEVNKSSTQTGKVFQKSIFAEPPKIAPDYSHLSKTYGTPYFSWYGIMSSDSYSVIAFVIVNVETTEVVAREIIFTQRKLNKRNLPPLMYDSFKNIK
jgi:hypothetical protein